MNLICERDALHGALSHIASRARGKNANVVPILAHAKLHAENDRLSLTATDLDTRSSAACSAEISETGATTVNAERLARLIADMPQGSQVKMWKDDDALHIANSRSRYKLPVLPAEDFPEMDLPRNASDVSLASSDAKHLFGDTIPGAATSDDRKHLTGGYLYQFAPGKLCVLCTDGIRLVRLVVDHDASLDRGYIVPKPAMGEIVKMASRGEVNLRCGENVIEATSGNFVFTSKLIEATYPDLEKFIQGAAETFILVDRTEFVAAFKRLSGIAEDGSTLNIKWKPGQPLEMTLSGQGAGSETVACECEIDEGLIAFAPSVLGPMIEVHKGDVLRLHMTGAMGPMKIIDPDRPGLTVLAMPCRPK